MDNHMNLTTYQAEEISSLEDDIRQSRKEKDVLKPENGKLESANESLRQKLEEAVWKSGGVIDEEETCEVAIVRPWCWWEWRKSLSPRELEEKGKALLVAAKNGQGPIVQQLINGGASLLYRNWFNESALHLAARNGHVDVVSALISAGANVDAEDNFGGTPLHWAAFSGHADVISVLINAGALIYATDNFGFTPLHETVRFGYPQCLDLLLAAGADPNATNCSGNTPLHFAAERDHEQCVRLLINNGADTAIRNCYGQTAKECAFTSAVTALFP